MSTGVENQWNADWLSQLRTPRGSLVYLSGYQLASSWRTTIQWLETVDDVTPFIDFGPRIGDITDDAMVRIMACRLIVSSTAVSHHRCGTRAGLATDTRTFGEALVNAFPRRRWCAMIKTERGILALTFRRCASRFRQPWWIPSAYDSHAGGVLAGLASAARGCRTAGKCGGASWVSGIAAATVRPRASATQKRIGRHDNN